MNAPDWVATSAAARLCRRTSTLKRRRGLASGTALPAAPLPGLHRAARMTRFIPSWVLRHPVAESAIQPLQAGDISEVERLLKSLPPPFDLTLDATAACAALPPDRASPLELSCSP